MTCLWRECEKAILDIHELCMTRLWCGFLTFFSSKKRIQDSFICLPNVYFTLKMSHIQHANISRVSFSHTHAPARMRTHKDMWGDSCVWVWHDSFVCVTWLVHVRLVWREKKHKFSRFKEIYDTSKKQVFRFWLIENPVFLGSYSTNEARQMRRAPMLDATRMNSSCHTYKCASISETWNACAQRLLPATLLERLPQVCCVKMTYELLPNNWFVSTRTDSMKCFANWIPANLHVRSNKTQRCLNSEILCRFVPPTRAYIYIYIYI